MTNALTPTPLIENPAPLQVTHRDISAHRRLRLFGGLLLLVGRMLAAKLTGRLTRRRIGRLIHRFCTDLGLLWIKFGQLMSMRVDLLGPEICEELASLQDQAPAFPSQQARAVIEAELQAPIGRLFSHFEDQPRAAASIGQVHNAVLRSNGRHVVVKVRRPGICAAFKHDMRLIQWMARLGGSFSVLQFVNWPDFLWELRQVIEEELDYRFELTNQMRMRKSLISHNIHVPRAYPKMSTRKILVMERVDGVPMIDLLNTGWSNPEKAEQWARSNGISRKRVGRKLLFSFLRQVLEDNLFHADLHPGNIFLQRNNRIVLLDFGSVGTMERDMLRKYDAYLTALSRQEFAKAIDIFLLLPASLGAVDLTSLKEELLRRLQSWSDRCNVAGIPYTEKSATWISDEMTRVFARYGIHIPWNFFKILRGWTTLDTSVRELMPESDMPGLMRAYTVQRKKREIAAVLKELPEDLLRMQNLIDYPREQSEIGTYQGASIRRLAQVFEGTTRVSKLAATIFGLASAGLFVCLAGGLYLWSGHSPALLNEAWAHSVPALDPQLWLLGLGVLGYNSYILGVLASRFRRNN